MVKLGLTLSALLLLGCDSAPLTPTPTTSPPANGVADAAHNARTSLDWAGTYEGMLPCSDCEAISTTLALYSDGHYQLRQTYVGKSAQEFIQQGTFSWNRRGDSVTLHSSSPHSSNQGDATLQFFVGENQLFLLDGHGQRIEGELAARYRLQKRQD